MTPERQALVAKWREEAERLRSAADDVRKRGSGSRQAIGTQAAHSFSAATLEACANDLEALSSSAPATSRVDIAAVQALFDRLEQYYDFECTGGPLRSCVDWQALKVLVLSSSAHVETPRMFPVQNGPDIPWSVIARFEKQARKQHADQSLERLAERGGLSVSEVLSIIDGDGNYEEYWRKSCHSRFDNQRNAAKLQALVAEQGQPSPADPPIQSPGDEARKEIVR